MIPTVIIHFQYYLVNNNSQFIVDKEKGTFTYIKKAIKQFSSNDIIGLEHFASFGGGSGVYSFGEYRYLKISLKDGEDVILTCLMIDNFKKNIDLIFSKNIEKELRLYCFLKIK